MIRFGYPYFGKKYLYDIVTNTLHYLVNEKPECRIDEIDEENVDMYSSLNEGSLITDHPVYRPCPHCMKKEYE
ncbi:hypothetical protein [Fonticella tunisiensis]|nr:hypothetical protein [Fonticella tunisiensis]